MAIPTFNIAGDLISGGISLYDYLQTNKQLKDLEGQPLPTEELSPELQNAYNLSANMANEGYTPQEKAAYQDQVNRASNTNYQRAVQLGGNNLSNEIKGSINSDSLLSYDKFAAQDAEIHRQNIKNLQTEADKIQQQKNAIQDQRLNYRYALEEALGNSNKTALEGIMKSFTLGGNLLNYPKNTDTNSSTTPFTEDTIAPGGLKSYDVNVNPTLSQ